MGYEADLDAIDPTVSLVAAGNSGVTTANGQVLMPYFIIHARLEDSAGRPMTVWNRIRYNIAAANQPLDGHAIRLVGRVTLGWVYGDFKPHTTDMIFANIVSPVRAYLEPGHGQV